MRINMDASQVLKQYFGYDSFRKGQSDIIEAILQGQDALAIMPTGAGKSVCYQVPAMLLSGITIVISPLISLMQDQVKSLNEAGINAAYINSTLSEQQMYKALDYAAQGKYKIIYVAPERLETMSFMTFAQKADISMVTIDEAHCISQWGQDFRPSYLKIVDFIDSLPERPVVSAFTATATSEVKTDIECILKLKSPKLVVTGFDRKNLYYSVEHLSGKKKDAYIAAYIKEHMDESGIIYCATRKNVDKLYDEFSSLGISVTKYHAGLDNETRKQNQDDFIYDRVQVVIATNAFGMGIDKSNVRYVIHYNMPQSMENYYQEAGRAGRDGGESQCILLFSAQDVIIDKFLLDSKEFEGVEDEDRSVIRERDLHRLHTMEMYCKTTECLRNYILSYFGEKTGEPCGNCGNCNNEYEQIDMTADAKWVINCLAETHGRFGLSIVLGTLLGAKRARLKEVGALNYKSYGKLSNRKEAELRLLIDQMINAGYVIQTDGEYSVLRMGDISPLRDENTHVYIKKAKKTYASELLKGGGQTGGEAVSGNASAGTAGSRPASRTRKKSTDSLTAAGYELFERLRALRLVIAREEGVPPYIIFNDKTLIDMCEKLPVDADTMLSVSGVGQNKLMKYGSRFTEEISTFVSAHKGVATTLDV
jgi:ATP-dependent DNA helicase RecQ|uniref:DNA helicase RecQ n=1 Tax=Lachnospira sp. TaxID=2049031 RepID=UPI003FEF17E0